MSKEGLLKPWENISPKLGQSAKKYIPALEWVPKYEKKYLKEDALAGLTVGAVVIPSAMAYASLVGIPPVYGLYAALVTLFVYFLFGTSRHLMVVPSSAPAAVAGAGILALGLTAQDQIIAVVGFMALLAGLLLIVARMINLGFLVNFISETVLIGFQLGLALYVISLQIGKVTGIPGGEGEFFDRISYYLTHLNMINVPTLAFAIIGFVMLMALEKYFPKLPSKLALVVIATFLVIIFSLTDYGIAVAGEIPNGLPNFVMPSNGGVPLTDIIPTVVGLFLIIFVEGISISKTFAREGKYKIDANQEMMGYGAPNFVTSFFQGMPVDASSSNTALAYNTGGRSQFTGVFAALVIITVLLFFASFFSNLPSAIIGVIIIVIMVKLVNYHELVSIYRFNPMEFVFAFVALMGVLLYGLIQGIFIGVAVTFIVVLYQTSMPYVPTLGRVAGTNSFSDIRRNPNNVKEPGILVVRIDGSLYFPSLQKISDEIMSKVEKEGPGLKLVILSLSATAYIDLNGVKMLREMHEELKAKGIEFLLSDITGSNRDVLHRAGLDDIFGALESNDTINDVIVRWKAKQAEGTASPSGVQVDKE